MVETGYDIEKLYEEVNLRRLGKDVYQAEVEGVRVEIDYSLPGRWFFYFKLGGKEWKGDANSLARLVEIMVEEVRRAKRLMKGA